MRPRSKLLRLAAAVLTVLGGACYSPAPIQLAPNAMRELVLPAAGQTEAAVVALNGDPDHREQVGGLEMWVYARTLPPVADLRSRSALVWFRDGIVVRAGLSGGFSAPNPTFPTPQPQDSGERGS